MSPKFILDRPESSPFLIVAQSLDGDSLRATAAFLKTTFPGSNKFTEDYLRWLYKDSPNGPALAFNAMSSNEIIGHYALIPMAAKINNSVHSGLLSVNTAVSKTRRLQGLFLTLAEHSFSVAKELGFKFIVGVANENSSHGFIGKLGFLELADLEARVSFGSARENLLRSFEVQPHNGFCTIWTESGLGWRMRNPSPHKYLLIETDLTKRADLRAAMSTEKSVASFKPFSVWIGCYPTGGSERRGGIQIPSWLKPAPLKLIFKSLVGPQLQVDPSALVFEGIDFDAF